MSKTSRNKYSYSRRNLYRKGKIEVTIKNDNKFSKLSFFSTIILVLITAFYAYQTYRLSELSSKQIILSAEPTIDLAGRYIRSKDGKVQFEMINLSQVPLKNIRFYSKYYTHLIDKDLNEFTLFRGMKVMAPDFEIERIEGDSSINIEFDFERSGLTKINDNTFFFIGTPPNVVKWPIRDINKFSNVTFAEFRIDFQREIDGKEYSRTFYYLIALSTDPKDRMFIRQTKQDIINQNRELARTVELIKSGSE